jgi:hypothetical protein
MLKRESLFDTPPPQQELALHLIRSAQVTLCRVDFSASKSLRPCSFVREVVCARVQNSQTHTHV